MKVCSFDTETYLIRDRGKATTNVCPRMVCAQYQLWNPDFEDPEKPELYLRTRGVDRFLELLDDEEVIFVALNMAYDLAVMARAVWEERGRNIIPDIFDLYDQNRVYDVANRAKLHDIRRGGRWGSYGLGMLVNRYFGVKLEGKSGEDIWRLRYAELDGVPVDVWPQRAVDYALGDVIWGLRLFRKMDAISPEEFENAAAWWLHLTSIRGLKSDLDWAARIDAYYASEEDEWWGVLRDADMTDGDKLPRDRKQELVAAAWEDIGEDPWETPTGQIKTSKEVFQHLVKKGVEEPLFQAYSNYNRASKFRTTYLEPVFAAGGEPLMPGFDMLKNTGRISGYKPNTQNFPAQLNSREIQRRREDPNCVVGADIRGVFVPRDGYCFVGCDYSAMELVCLSEYYTAHTGRIGKMGQAINDGKDLHSLAASDGLRISYQEAMLRKAVGKSGMEWERACEHVIDEYGVADSDISRWASDGLDEYLRTCEMFARWRQVYKCANFSFPVGANALTFSKQVRARGLEFTNSEGEYVREQWYRAWPEMNEFQMLIQSFATGMNEYVVEYLGPYGQLSGWMQARPSKSTEAANYTFQSLGAMCILLAGYKITHEAYTDEQSPLYGSRPVLCVHDELVLETPIEKAEAVGGRRDENGQLIEEGRLAEAMVAWSEVFLEHIQPSAEAEIMYERWEK